MSQNKNFHTKKRRGILKFYLILWLKILKFSADLRQQISKFCLWLLKRNFVIKFNNRNFFLLNAVSAKEYHELLQYFKALNVKIEDQTDFIPQAQNSGYFTDKNEIYSDDFSDTQIPKKNFKWKLRRFFSLD